MMLQSIGIDLVEINRFRPWISSSPSRLEKIFTEREIEIFFSETGQHYDHNHDQRVTRKASYLASRFAAKEAFFKALSSLLVSKKMTDVTFGLIFACKHVEVVKKTWGIPELHVSWKAFEDKIGTELGPIDAHLSLAHEGAYAVATVMLSAQ